MTLQEFYKKQWMLSSWNETADAINKFIDDYKREQVYNKNVAEWKKQTVLSMNETPYWDTSRFRSKPQPVEPVQEATQPLQVERPTSSATDWPQSRIQEPLTPQSIRSASYNTGDAIYKWSRELTNKIWNPEWQTKEVPEDKKWLQKALTIASRPAQFVLSIIPSVVWELAWFVSNANKARFWTDKEKEESLEYLAEKWTEQASLFGKVKTQEDIDNIYNVIRSTDAYTDYWYSDKDAKLMRWTLLTTLWWAKALEMLAMFYNPKSRPWTTLTKTRAWMLSDMDYASRTLLWVSDDASNEQINRAARTFLRKYHPDNQATGNSKVFNQYSSARDFLIKKNKDVANAKFTWQVYDDPFEALGLNKATATEKDIDEAVYDLLDVFRWNRDEIDNIYRARKLAIDDLRWTRRTAAIQKMETAARWQASWEPIVTPRRAIANLPSWEKPALVSWVSQTPNIPAQNTPQVEFQIPNQAAIDTVKSIESDIQKNLAKRTQLAEAGAWTNKTQIDRINTRINTLRQQLGEVSAIQNQFSWPVSTRSMADRTREVPAMVSTSRAWTTVTWSVSAWDAKTSVIKVWTDWQTTTVVKPIEISVPEAQVGSKIFEQPYITIAEHMGNDAVIFKNPDGTHKAVIINKNYTWPKLKTEKDKPAKPLTVKKVETVKKSEPPKKVVYDKPKPTATPVVKSVPTKKVSKPVVKTPEKEDILKWPMKTIKDFDTTYEYGKYLEKREQAMNRANIKPTEKVKSSAVDFKKPITIKTLEWMEKAWATEDDFNKLYDMLVKEERYDEAMDVSMYSADKLWDDFIDDIDWPLYSKKSTPIDNYEARAAAVGQKKIEKLHSMAYDIVKKYASAADRRNIPRGVRGLYRPDWDIIAVKSLNDISLVAHEVAHAIDVKSGIIDDLIKEWNQPVISALRSLYIKNNPKTRAVGKTNTEMLREWFAEFIEWMVTEPIKTAWENPELLMFLNKEWGKMDVVKEMLKGVWDIVKYYQSLWALEKTMAKSWVVVVDPSKRWLPIQEQAIRFLSDYVRPFEYLARLQGKHRTIKDPSVWFRAKKVMSYVFADNFQKSWPHLVLTKDGNIKKALPYNWRDLLEKVGKDGADSYSAYRINRRYYYINKRIKELQKKWDKLTELEQEELKEKTSQLVRSRIDINDVNESYLSNRAKYAEHDKMFDKLLNENIKLWMRFWFITESYGKELLKEDWYSPFMKLIIDESNQVDRRLFKSKWWTPFWYKKFKGSDDPILDPVVGFFRLAYETNKKALLQETLNRIYALAPQSKWAVKIVSSKKTSLWVFTPKVNWNTAEFMRNWKIIKMELNNDLAKVFKTDSDLWTNSRAEAMFSKVMSGITQATTGALYPAFGITNLMIDTPAAIAQSKSSVVPIYDGVRALVKAYKDKWWVEYERLKLWLSMGWAEQTIMALYKDNPDNYINIMLAEQEWLAATVKDTALLFKKKASAVVTYSEIVNRFWEFSKWLDSWRSVLEAWWDATRVSAPFAHTGEVWWRFGRLLLKGALYWRAWFHVTWQFLDTMYYKETRWKWLAIATALAWVQWLWTILWYLYIQNSDIDEDEKKRLYARLRNLSLYDISNNLIIIKWQSAWIAKLRVPNNYAVAKSIVSMLIGNALLDAWYRPKEFLQVTADWILPQQLNILDPKKAVYSMFVPHLAQWFVGIAWNFKSFPEFKKIVPEYIKKRPSHEQYTPYTNDIAIRLWQTALAKELNLWPMEIEYLMGVYWGRATTRYTQNIDEDFWIVSGFLKTFPLWFTGIEMFKPSEYIFTWRQVDEFYKGKDKAYDNYSSLRDDRNASPKERTDAKEISDMYADVAKIVSWLKAIHREKWSVSPAYEATVLDTINLLNKWKIDEAKKEFEKYRYQMQSDIRRAEMEAKYSE